MFQVALEPTVYAKKEDTAGVLNAPTVAADIIKCKSATLRPFVTENDTESVTKSHFGNDEVFPAGIFVEVTLQVYLTGSGAAGDAPPWALLHKACGYNETLNVGVDAQYALAQQNTDTLTLFVNAYGNRHPVSGCRGDVSYRFDNNKLPYCEYKFVGVFNDPVAQSLINPDWSAWRAPAIVGNANTATCTLHGEDLGLVNLQYGNNVALEMVNIPGYQGVDNDNRSPGGSVTFSAPLVTAKNWFTAVKNRTKGSLIVEHGTVAGDIVRLELGNTQVLNPEYVTVLGNKSGLKLDLNPLPLTTAGNDDHLLIVK